MVKLHESLLVLLPLVKGHLHNHNHHHNHEDHEHERRLVRRDDVGGWETVTDASKYTTNGPFTLGGTSYRNSQEFVMAGLRCRTRDLTSERREVVNREIQEFMEKTKTDGSSTETGGWGGFRNLQSGQQEIVVDTFIHVVYKEGPSDPSNVSTATIEKQLQVLNSAYRGESVYTDCSGKPAPAGLKTPFRFNLIEITRTHSDDWHKGVNDNEMRQTLRKGTCSDLNIYISDARGFLGFGTLASWCEDTSVSEDQVSINWQTLPEVSNTQFSQGDTMVHEVGHWLGLEHTFEGGCRYVNDGVEDTPAERTPGYGCPVGRDTCYGGGVDPITNFMDYSDDCCMYSFSTGQHTRMIQQVMTYRNLVFTPVAPPGSPPPVPDTNKTVPPAPTPVARTCSSDKLEVEVAMIMDEWPEETSWEIVSVQTSESVASYQANSNQKFRPVSLTQCLDPTEQYMLILKDTYGDGMGATGSYELKVQGETVTAGGNFAFEDTVVFGARRICPGGQKNFLIILETDSYGFETSWIIRDNTSLSVLYRARLNDYLDNKRYLEERCLPSDKSMKFLIRDQNNDGICCGGGRGYYAIYLEGRKLQEGGKFTDAEGRNFLT